MMGNEARAFRQLFPQRHIPVVLSSVLQAGGTLRKKSDTEFEDRITIRLCKELVTKFILFWRQNGCVCVHPMVGWIRETIST
jgi:hypothetical protein